MITAVFVVVVVAAVAAVVWARVRRAALPAPEVEPAPTPRRSGMPEAPEAPPPRSADPAVERERVAIRRLRVVEWPARTWEEEVGVVEALWVLGRAAPVPPGREALAAYVHAVREGRGAVERDRLGPEVAPVVEALEAERDPDGVWRWEEARGAAPGMALLLAAARRGRARPLVAAVADPRAVLGPVVVAGLEAGHPDDPLLAAFAAGEAEAWARDDRRWLGWELRRRVLDDPDGAAALRAQLLETGPLDPWVEEVVAAASFRRHGVPMTGIAGEGSVEERVGRLLAAAAAGADLRLELPGVRVAVAEAADVELFGALVRLDLRRADPTGLAETLALCGPEGWQIASAAWEAIRLVPPARRGACLEVLRGLVRPGPLAAAGGTPPAWFAPLQPRPTDLLVVYAALGEAGPWWAGAPDAARG